MRLLIQLYFVTLHDSYIRLDAAAADAASASANMELGNSADLNMDVCSLQAFKKPTDSCTQ